MEPFVFPESRNLLSGGSASLQMYLEPFCYSAGFLCSVSLAPLWPLTVTDLTLGEGD